MNKIIHITHEERKKIVNKNEQNHRREWRNTRRLNWNSSIGWLMYVHWFKSNMHFNQLISLLKTIHVRNIDCEFRFFFFQEKRDLFSFCQLNFIGDFFSSHESSAESADGYGRKEKKIDLFLFSPMTSMIVQRRWKYSFFSQKSTLLI